MIRLKTAALVALMTAAMATTAMAEDTIESVTKDIEMNWQKVKTLTATLNQTYPQQATDPSKTEGGLVDIRTCTGSLTVDNSGGKSRVRLEFNITSTVKIPRSPDQVGKEQKIFVNDGNNVIHCKTDHGLTVSIKYRLDQQPLAAGGKALIQMIEKYGEMKLEADQSTGGESCWVISVKLKNPLPATPVQNLYYLRKSDGFLAKVEELDANGKPLIVTEYADFKVGDKVSSSAFEVETPPNSVVKDMTKKK